MIEVWFVEYMSGSFKDLSWMEKWWHIHLTALVIAIIHRLIVGSK